MKVSTSLQLQHFDRYPAGGRQSEAFKVMLNTAYIKLTRPQFIKMFPVASPCRNFDHGSDCHFFSCRLSPVDTCIQNCRDHFAAGMFESQMVA